MIGIAMGGCSWLFMAGFSSLLCCQVKPHEGLFDDEIENIAVSWA